MTQRATYFQNLDNLRADNAQIYDHDETWCNVGEEKRSIWVSDFGQGRLRKSDGKGERIAISVLINEHGLDKWTVDIFPCDEEHSVNRDHFIEWLRKATAHLRRYYPKPTRKMHCDR